MFDIAECFDREKPFWMCKECDYRKNYDYLHYRDS
jgi:hypothetical protein